MSGIYYKPVGKEVEVFTHAFHQKLPLLLKGPTGCGKSRFVEYMAQELNTQLITITCHEETSAVDLIGRYLVQGSDTVWQDGPLTRAVREGCIIYLDEIAEARPDVLVAIHSLTDHRRALYIDRHNETIIAPDTFMLVASFNPGYQRGIKEMKPSTRQRFIGLNFNYPNQEQEIEIIRAETGICQSDAIKLVKLADKTRKRVELGLIESASTRLLVDAGKLIADGLPPRLSCEVAMVEPLTDDNEVRSALNDLVAMVF
jgi:nitric oxide reductase NorQ protein